MPSKISIINILLIIIPFAFASYNWTEVDHAIENAIKNSIFSGCVLGIATNNATLLKKAYGTVGPKRGFYSPPITTDMRFDLGSLTEPIALNSLLMDQFEKAIVIPTNKVSFILSEFNNNGKRYITIQNLLEHNSGMNRLN